MPILVGTDGVQKMSKSLGNYVGVTDAPEEMFGRLMSIPDEAMAEYYRLLLGAEQPGGAAQRGQARAGPADRRPLPRRGGRRPAAEEHFNRVIRDHGVPDEIPRWDIEPAAGDEPGAILLPRADRLAASSSARARRGA